MNPTRRAPRAQLLRAGIASLFAAWAASGCTYGVVVDADEDPIGGAEVHFQQPNLSGLLPPRDIVTGAPTRDVVPTLTPGVRGYTWYFWQYQANGAAGYYYLNPYGTFDPTDVFGLEDVYVPPGWQRVEVSRDGYQTRVFYRNHLYEPCTWSAAQGPYSGGVYPFVPPWVPPFADGSDIGVAETVCREQSFALEEDGALYVHDADIVVDIRSMRDFVLGEGPDECSDIADDYNEMEQGSISCMRVTVATVNVGEGPMRIRAVPDGPDGVPHQERYWSNGTTRLRVVPNGKLVYEVTDGHDHVHFEGWAAMRLRRIDGRCDTEERAANCPVGGTAVKTGTCLRDSYLFDSELEVEEYTEVADPLCADYDMAMSPGHADIYHKDLPGQTIDTTDFEPGAYWLEVEANPVDAQSGERLVVERDYSNNVARVQVFLE